MKCGHCTSFVTSHHFKQQRGYDWPKGIVRSRENWLYGFTALYYYGYRLNDISLQRLLWFPISVSTITFVDTKNSNIHVLDWDPGPRENWLIKNLALWLWTKLPRCSYSWGKLTAPLKVRYAIDSWRSRKLPHCLFTQLLKLHEL